MTIHQGVERDQMFLDYETLIHFTPTADQRKAFAKSGAAMPDGSFYIRNQSDLSNAINAVGRATPNASESVVARRNSVRRHIIKRANDLKLASMIPDTWNSDGSLKQSALIGEFLEHFGVRGMKWGIRRGDNVRGGSSPAGLNHPSLTAPRMSLDAQTANMLRGKVKTGGTQTLSNRELQTLVNRMGLERQYGSLNPAHVSAGRKFMGDIAKDTARQSAQTFIKQYGPKGAKWLAKRAGLALTGLAVRGALAAL